MQLNPDHYFTIIIMSRSTNKGLIIEEACIYFTLSHLKYILILDFLCNFTYLIFLDYKGLF